MKTMKNKLIDFEVRMNGDEPGYKGTIIPVMKKALTIRELMEILKTHNPESIVQIGQNHDKSGTTIAYAIDVASMSTGDGEDGNIELIEIVSAANSKEMKTYLREQDLTADELPSKS